jgi:subtilase family serine protease
MKIRQVSIAIIVAYSYPKLQNDFYTFCRINGLTPSLLHIVNLNKSTKKIKNPNMIGWFEETCLDVQMCYAMNPNAKIHVIGAVSDSQNDLLNAVKYANNVIKPDIVSMSWGCTEFANEESYNSSVFSNPNICYLAASGDTASIVSFPSCDSNVLSCG